MENIKEYVARKKQELKEEITANNYKIKLVIIQVGDNPASNAYVKGKLKDCGEVGIDCELIKLAETIPEEVLLDVINMLNVDDSVTGFIVQLPLPKHINEARVVEAVDYRKDVDGFTKRSAITPATPQGILNYLEDNNYEFENKNVVVIGRSNIVGRPMAELLLDKSCNVTVIHSKTSTIKKLVYINHADLIVVATGCRNTLTDDDFERTSGNAFIVDVGMNRNDAGKLCGDCEAVTVCEKTPVPGGVGLLTRFALLTNTVKAYKLYKNK